MTETNYKKYGKEIEKFLNSKEYKEVEQKGPDISTLMTSKITDFSAYENELADILDEQYESANILFENYEKEPVRDLRVWVSSTTRTVDLLDKFEGIGDNLPYDRLIIRAAFYLKKDNFFGKVDLVIERSNRYDFEGDITFTNFKQGYTRKLKEFVLEQVSESQLIQSKKTKEMIRFNKYFCLRAQNSRNRSGYGWEWDWTGGYGTYTEGTYYGETTNYAFVGLYVSEY